MRFVISGIIALMTSCALYAQVARDQVLMTQVETGENSLTIKWPNQNVSGTLLIFRREVVGSGDWGSPVATVAGSAGEFVDNSVVAGKGYEYFIRNQSNTNPFPITYLYAGVKREVPGGRGGLILLVDSTYKDALATEIERLEKDLKNEGWFVVKDYAGRTEKVTEIKARIKSIYTNSTTPIRSLFILGHVNIPYSGDFSGTSGTPPPDGHTEGKGDHVGAWPADAYYADIEDKDLWSDFAANNTKGASSRNHNVPNDGKFDNSKIPSAVELEMGRVDLFNLPLTGESDTDLMRKYLDRNHAFRTGEWTYPERAVIDNNFKGYNLASTGYHTFSTMFPLDSIGDNDSLNEYLASQQKQGYLWSYGCGPGSYTSCSGVATSKQIVKDTMKNVFTILAGSFFGDWDSPDNIMRTTLANQTLAVFWGGIPKWYVHHMALGEHIGLGARLTMNNVNDYFNGGFNLSENSVHIALLGDPTLCQRYIPGASALQTNSSNGKVELNWSAPAGGGIDGYNVYIVHRQNGTFKKVNTSLITSTSYTDATNWYSGEYEYAVRTVKLEKTASGSYYNLGPATFETITHVNGLEENLTNALELYPNPARTQLKIRLNGFEMASFSILDFSGRTITTGSLNGNETQISLEGIKEGCYAIKIITTDGRLLHKSFQVLSD